MITEITNKEALSIIETRLPLGNFWLKENDKYVAISNEDGNAWTEEFDTMEECMDYLREEYNKL